MLVATSYNPRGDPAWRKLERSGPSRNRLASHGDGEGDASAVAKLRTVDAERSPRIPRNNAELDGCTAANQINDEIVEFIVADFDDGGARVE